MPTPGEMRDLNVRLLFKTDSQQTDKALKDMEVQGKRTAEALRDVRSQASLAGNPGPGGVPGVGRGGGGGGGGSDVAQLLKFAAIAGSVSQTMAGVGRAMDAATQKANSFGQGVGIFVDQLAESVPILGGIWSGVKGFITSLAYGADKRSLSNYMAERGGNEARADIDRRRSEFLSGVGQQTRAADRALEMTRQQSARSLLPYQGGGALLGGAALGFQNAADPRLIEAMQRVSLAQDAIGGAGAEKQEADSERARLQERAIRSAANRDRLQREKDAYDKGSLFGADGTKNKDFDVNQFIKNQGDNKYKLAEREQRLADAQKEALKDEEALLKGIENQKQKSLQAAQRQYDLDKARVDVLKAQRDIIGDELAKRQASAQQFGSMGAADKLAVKFALERSQREGFGNLTQEERGLLQQTGVTQDYANKEARKLAKDDPLYKELQKMLGQESDQKLQERNNELAEAIAKKTAEINNKFAEDSARIVGEKMAESMAEALRLFANQVKSIDQAQIAAKAIGGLS